MNRNAVLTDPKKLGWEGNDMKRAVRDVRDVIDMIIESKDKQEW